MKCRMCGLSGHETDICPKWKGGDAEVPAKPEEPKTEPAAQQPAASVPPPRQESGLPDNYPKHYGEDEPRLEKPPYYRPRTNHRL